jgi:hypothetical protein
MTNPISGTITRTFTPAFWVMMLALAFAASPLTARTQETQAAAQSAATAQTPQIQQVAGQEPDKAGPEKDKTNEKKDEKKDDSNNPKNDRIFLVIPNYGTVEHPTANVAPLTVKQKFKTGAEDAFDTYSVPLAGVVAAISQAKNDDAEWGQGWGVYGKRYAATYADTLIGSFMTTGVYPSLLHEDPRYFRMGTGGFRKRSWYAVTRLFVIRTDAGKQQFNYSEFMGNATAAGISLTYHTKDERNFSSFGGDYLTQIAIDAFANQLKEFWPDIRHKLHKNK